MTESLSNCMPPLCVSRKTIYNVVVASGAGGQFSMFCASCGKVSVEEQKLCIGCGSVLGPACPWCGSSNPCGATFCCGCRAQLSEPGSAAGYAAQLPEPESFAAGRYQVTAFDHASGAKRVYLANDSRLGRKVSISVISTRGLSDDARAQVMQVARAAARLAGHPHIAGVYEAGEEDGLVYVLSEYLAGGSLDDLVSRVKNHRLPIADVLRIGTEICEALEYAHSLGVVHGDLACASVRIAPEGSVKLTDFGLGLPLTINLSELAGESIAVETPAYVAPEQLLGRPPEPRSDLYSLGVILHQMLAGDLPFVWGDSADRIARRVAPKPLQLDRHDIPEALQSLVRSLLQKRPERRPPSAASVGGELRWIAATPRPGPISIVLEAAPLDSHDVSLDMSAGGAALRSANPWAALNVVSYAAPLSSAIAAVAMLAVLSVGSMRVAYKWFGQFNSMAAPRAEWPQLATERAARSIAIASAPAEPKPLAAPAAAQPNHEMASIAALTSPAAPAAENRAHSASADSGGGAEAFQELFDLAREGNPDAQAALGNMYLRGEDASRNYAEAVRWFEQGAAAGNTQAQVGLGYMYAIGKGVTQDYKQAVKWFRMASASGDPDAEYNLAVMYDQGQGVSADRAEALKWLRRSAAQDDVSAQYELGRKYMEGQGVEQDYSRALQWLRKAAGHGSIPAENALGYLYEKSGSELRDYALAARWYRKAAEQGDARAQLNLGIMYEDGEGGVADYGEAVRWYLKAAEQGEAYAQTRLGVVYCKGKGVARDYAKATEWFLRAASQDEPKAEYNLGIIYDTGLGVSPNYAAAARWYRKAAAQGNADAQYNLGYLYEHGQGVARDTAAALEWYRSAAIQGDSSALERVKVLQSKAD